MLFITNPRLRKLETFMEEVPHFPPKGAQVDFDSLEDEILLFEIENVIINVKPPNENLNIRKDNIMKFRSCGRKYFFLISSIEQQKGMAKRMKIENVKNINLNAPSANTVKSAAKADTKRQSGISPNGRFDTFTMIGTVEKKDNSDSVNTLDAKTAELVRSLSALSAEEKVEFAYDSYLDMQKALLHMKDMVNAQVESFKDLKDKKVYYTDLLSSGCTIGEGGGKY